MATNIKQGVVVAQATTMTDADGANAFTAYKVVSRFDTTADALKALRKGDLGEGTFDILAVNREGEKVEFDHTPRVKVSGGTARITRKRAEAPEAPTAGATEVPVTEPAPRRGGGLFGRGSA